MYEMIHKYQQKIYDNIQLNTAPQNFETKIYNIYKIGTNDMNMVEKYLKFLQFRLFLYLH